MAEKTTKEQNNSDAQSRRVLSGNEFEREIFDYIKKEIGDNPNVSILKPKTHVYPPGSDRDYEFSCMQILTPHGDVIGDTDIVIFDRKRNKPLILVSCKISLRERMSQSLFHWFLYKAEKDPEIKLFFVTKDPDLEFGTRENPRKWGVLAAHLGVYCYSQNPLTESWGTVYPFKNMIKDLKRMARIKKAKRITNKVKKH
ncbi:MAG: BsaWI family type II restriction enzyme [Methanoregula sp.]